MKQHCLKYFGIKVHISHVCWDFITSILPYLYKHIMSRQFKMFWRNTKCCAIDIETFKNLSQCCKTIHAPAFSSGFFIIKLYHLTQKIKSHMVHGCTLHKKSRGKINLSLSEGFGSMLHPDKINQPELVFHGCLLAL